MNTTTKTTDDMYENITRSEARSKMGFRKLPAKSLHYDPSRGRPLKSAAEAEAAIKRNRKEASKAAKRGWSTRRRRERENDVAAAEAAASDCR